MENTLGIAGNEFFNDNREDKPIDDYSSKWECQWVKTG